MASVKMRTIRVLAVAICTVLANAYGVANEDPEAQQPTGTSEAVRTWSDASGKYQIEASYLGYEKGNVLLRRTNGSEINVPLEKLGDSEKKYVRLKLRSKPLAAHEPKAAPDDPATEEDVRRRKAAHDLVLQAIAADLNGRTTENSQLLARAVDLDPGFAPARWLSGQVMSGKAEADWISVEEAEQLAADDPVLSEYARRREEAKDGVKSQEALALWSRKQGLHQREKVHWRRVLAHDPQHRAAQRCLQLQEHNGRLLTREQIAEAKQRAVVLEQKRKEWMPKLNEWRKAIQSNDEAAADEARRQLEDLRDPDLVGLLESYLSPRSERLSIAVVEALENMPAQTATDSLVRHAVQSKWSGVRKLAGDRLKDRPKYSYVPMLIDGMTAPLKFSSWMTGSDIAYLVLQEGKSFDHMLEGTVEIRAIANSNDNGETDQVRSAEAAEQAKRSRAKEVARELENYIQRKNQAAAQVNEPFRRALALTTGEDLGLDPIEWNDWWNRFNENEVPARKPVVTTRKYDRAYAEYTPVQGTIRKPESRVRPPDFAGGWSRFMEGQTARLFNQADDPANVQNLRNDFLVEVDRQSAEAKRYQEELQAERQRKQAEEALERERSRKEWESRNPEEAARRKLLETQRAAELRVEIARRIAESRAARAANPHECFPAGTLVRTQSGQRPIEEIRSGDLVLSQDPDSGELTYKPVVRTTVRPADKLLGISLGGETLRTTKGHPIWVGERGWLIAKYIQPGDRMHRYFGSIEVEAVREVPVKENVYNLVVDGFHSYFVGENSVLVHDNSIITPPVVSFLGEKLVARR